jgi:hypothetical protein
VRRSIVSAMNELYPGAVLSASVSDTPFDPAAAVRSIFRFKVQVGQSLKKMVVIGISSPQGLDCGMFNR